MKSDLETVASLMRDKRLCDLSSVALCLDWSIARVRNAFTSKESTMRRVYRLTDENGVFVTEFDSPQGALFYKQNFRPDCDITPVMVPIARAS